jgi:phytoene dehydrogenase-like protein
MDKKKILIIGGGIGGLSTALRLSKYPNLDITIIEKNNQFGGRLNKIEKDGFIFDTGPSFFSMSYEFEELDKDAGLKKLPFDYEPLETLYQVSFNNGES